jgi:DNA-binding MarR family transcriptional regulator
MQNLAYVKFLKLMRSVYKDDHDTRRIDDLLAYLYEVSLANRKVNMTDLVKQESFGTLQTLTKYLRRMATEGLVAVNPGEDRRTSVVTITSQGIARLSNREQLLQEAIAG